MAGRLNGNTIYNQTTTQHDARRRPIFRTVWLTTAPNVDPNNPPFAGQNGVPANSGLTTQWYYDENLADDVGLSSTAGQTIAGIGNVSIKPLLAEVQSDGVTFGAGSDGYAVLEVKPDGELWVTIEDGADRTVASGAIQPPTAQNPNQPITWSTRLDDNVATVSSPGNLVETAYIDALGNTTRGRADGAGRTIQAVDAESNVTAMTFDANSGPGKGDKSHLVMGLIPFSGSSWGPKAGKSCKGATSADILACLQSKPRPTFDPGPANNCQTDVVYAASGCCLCTSFQPASIGAIYVPPFP